MNKDDKQFMTQLFGKLDQKIDSVAVSLDQKIDSVAASLDRKIDSVEEKLGQRIDGLDQKFDHLDRKVDNLDQKVDSVAGHLDQKIGGLDQKIDSVAVNLDQKIGGLDQKVDSVDRRLTDEIRYNGILLEQCIHNTELIAEGHITLSRQIGELQRDMVAVKEKTDLIPVLFTTVQDHGHRLTRLEEKVLKQR